MSEDLVLSIERLMDAPASALWKAYTDHLDEWFCPPPWRAEVKEMDLRTGGRSAITMYGPEGEVMPNEGVYLEVVPERRIVFTDAFRGDWQPAGPFMVGFFEFEPRGARTLYRGRARHWTREACDQHKAMGFEAGWGTVAEQWEAVAKRFAQFSLPGQAKAAAPFSVWYASITCCSAPSWLRSPPFRSGW